MNNEIFTERFTPLTTNNKTPMQQEVAVMIIEALNLEVFASLRTLTKTIENRREG